MSKTVVVISESGRLIDVTGALKESDDHYKRFARRLLGEDGTYTVLDYGWNGRNKLKITGANGQEILLDAQYVKVSGTLKINNVPLQELISNNIDIELSGLQGTTGEINVVSDDNPDSGDNQSRKIYTISLSSDFMSRFRSVENQLAGIFSFDGVYYAGDGLVTREDPVNNTLNVFIGTGLKFESKSYDELIGSSESSPSITTITKLAIAVDCESAPIPLSVKPITAGAVYNALGGTVLRYMLSIESATGNVVLFDTLESIPSSQED